MRGISVERREANTLLQAWCADVRGHVLSIGSAGDSDKQGRSYRDYFPHATVYITSDVVDGCDLTLDVRSMPGIDSGSFDAVFCSGVLEHVDDCHAAVAECHRVLSDGGTFLVGVPFNQKIHRAPMDFWRFTEFGVRYLLRAFERVELVALGEPSDPAAYWARAVKA